MRASTRRGSEALTEIRHNHLLRGATTAMMVAAAGRAVQRTRAGFIAGCAAGILESSVSCRFASLERGTRNAEDAALLAPLLGSLQLQLGTWAVEPDFLRLLATELYGDPGNAVELGSGASTVLMAAIRQQRGGRPLVSIDHDPSFADRTRKTLALAGLTDAVEIHVAPLRGTTVRGKDVLWYDRRVIERVLPSQIDFLVVDGPPSTNRYSRWPALEVLSQRLTDRGVVLLDDGRRHHETATAVRWARDNPSLALFWHDTVKGTWRLEPAPRSDGFGLNVARRGLRTVDAHPGGFGRWHIRR